MGLQGLSADRAAMIKDGWKLRRMADKNLENAGAILAALLGRGHRMPPFRVFERSVLASDAIKAAMQAHREADKLMAGALEGTGAMAEAKAAP